MDTVGEVNFQGFQHQLLLEVVADLLPEAALARDGAPFDPDVEMEMLDVASEKRGAVLEKWYDCAFVFEMESVEAVNDRGSLSLDLVIDC